MPSQSLRRLARSIMGPLARPLDGRVGDVNRRVGDVDRHVADVSESVEELARKVGAHTATVTESNSYLGVELRRFWEELEGLRSGIDAHERRLFDRIDSIEARGYVERLDRAAEMPLAKLDGALAHVINHAIGHRGFLAEAGLWFNPPVSVELAEGTAELSSVNERIVELAFAFGALARLDPPARILDVGSAESTFALSAASLGYAVTASDLRPLPYTHPNLDTIVGPLEQWKFEGPPFDAVFLISTIEHVGLGAYGEPTGAQDADQRMLRRVRDMLVDDGLLVLTTPFGVAEIDDLQRTYNEATLSELLTGWSVLDEKIVSPVGERTWVAGETPSGARAGVAMVLAVPTRTGGTPDREPPGPGVEPIVPDHPA